MVARQQAFYPNVRRNFAGVTYYSGLSSLVELSVEIGTGKVELISHHHLVDCGSPIVPELVSGQLQGGVAMGIGHDHGANLNTAVCTESSSLPIVFLVLIEFKPKLYFKAFVAVSEIGACKLFDFVYSVKEGVAVDVKRF